MATIHTPSIACIGDNPLHISLFQPHLHRKLEFSFLLNSCLDIFDIRTNNKTIDQDLGLLQAVDERLACYGWLTTTGIKFVIVVDMAGREVAEETVAEERKKKGASALPIVGLRESDLKPAFRALQTAYIHLLQNPFYKPDDHRPMIIAKTPGARSPEITNKKFIGEVQRIGKAWVPGVASV
ncbi:MAG: hypothetical protein Q9227_007184 [Pyrenula ochraceoflavens]